MYSISLFTKICIVLVMLIFTYAMVACTDQIHTSYTDLDIHIDSTEITELGYMLLIKRRDINPRLIPVIDKALLDCKITNKELREINVYSEKLTIDSLKGLLSPNCKKEQ